VILESMRVLMVFVVLSSYCDSIIAMIIMILLLAFVTQSLL